MMRMLTVLFFWLSCAQASDLFKMDGWRVEGEVLKYNPGNLWEYINGAADQFIDFGFEELQTAELRADSVLVAVEIYNMGTPINAFGIYMIERPDEADHFKIGTESVVNLPSQGLLLKNYHYVKMHLFEGSLSRDAWTELLRKTAAQLPGDNGWPGTLDRLPKENMVRNSIGYVRTNFLGLSELNQCVFADYEHPGSDPYQRFIILTSTDGSEFIKGLPDKWENERDVWIRKIPYQGYIGIKLNNGVISGVARIKHRETILDLLND